MAGRLLEIRLINNLESLCYGPSVISVTVTKGGHPRGSGLHRTSKTIGQGVSWVM